MARLDRSFFARSAVHVAPQLLNKVLVHGETAGRIVEVEAYDGGNDPASHAYRGMTARNAVMFGPPGHLYVYFTYGMHYCCNVVCGSPGTASAVLIRALEPIAGIDAMQSRRSQAGQSLLQLTSGPAKLCQALGIDRTFDGTDLLDAESSIQLIDDGTAPPSVVAQGTRIGIREGTDLHWRWWLSGNRHVSRPQKNV